MEAQFGRQGDLDRYLLAAVPRGLQLTAEDRGKLGEAR